MITIRLTKHEANDIKELCMMYEPYIEMCKDDSSKIPKDEQRKMKRLRNIAIKIDSERVKV